MIAFLVKMHHQLMTSFPLFVRFYSNENQRVHNEQTSVQQSSITMRTTSNHTRLSQNQSTSLEETPPILDNEQDENQKPVKETPVSRKCGGRKTASVQPISKPKEREDVLKVQKEDSYYVNPKAKSKKGQHMKDVSKSQE